MIELMVAIIAFSTFMTMTCAIACLLIISKDWHNIEDMKYYLYACKENTWSMDSKLEEIEQSNCRQALVREGLQKENTQKMEAAMNENIKQQRKIFLSVRNILKTVKELNEV